MAIQDNYELPSSPQHLPFPMPLHPSDSNANSTANPPAKEIAAKPIFLLFLASNDPATGKPWCEDVRAALPVVRRLFGADGDGGEGEEGAVARVEVRFVYVGGKEGWKVKDNVYRTTWGVDAIPCLTRYEWVDGRVVEVGRLVEGELLDEGRVKGFVV
ncbi:hypothetical protein T440DRAFT_451430 [Plenodomus tracheiphilus IPT5]|uniref:Thioredoxin domain-containing protein n=1 Tax=Plenodomus tracheiphilus IPT5 TaxID=1408161 RepID=A0A6A7B2V0_9PLEO|nr:hypothetical protein T440DRAFT_451430 [Plenodomus tracheiphilus IPT5]